MIVHYTCLFCQKPFSLSTRCGPRKYCSSSCCYEHRRKDWKEGFYERLVPNLTTGCLEWPNSNKLGYGFISRRKAGKTTCKVAHRLAWEFANGPIPDGLFVCHKCDNPACCNVEHLFLGTHLENIADMMAKGRHAKGAETNSATLTEAQVVAMREEYRPRSVSFQTLAEKYGVTDSAVENVVNRKTWKHVL